MNSSACLIFSMQYDSKQKKREMCKKYFKKMFSDQKKLSIPQEDMSFRCSSAFVAAILQASSSVVAVPNTTDCRLVDMDRRIVF
ncbi:hypothetical protein B7P43_G10801 [Cryptotermes secundus]|uniref:Uncharacterized protein n=1 Tax=Cryptotermes secundus TaxID=105785 RepID=A0A2J7RRK1_9NEOP|nr:hypothetical protein B7P43_G10801 [Cryptotermes secundus]